MAPVHSSTPAAPSVAVMVLVDSRTVSWAWARLVRGPGALRGEPGLRFAKVLGSGSEGGFGIRPSATRGGLFCVFDSLVLAQQFLQQSGTLASYRRHARELCTVLLHPFSCRGSWDGQTLASAAAAPSSGPVAALTRASIRPSRVLPFWRRAPAAQRSMESAVGCRLGVGLGEAPLLRQATFSIWDNTQAMDAYARTGAHLEAVRASQQGAHFSESMFVRFVPEGLQGTWKGRQHG